MRCPPASQETAPASRCCVADSFLICKVYREYRVLNVQICQVDCLGCPPPMQVLADAASGKPGYERAMTADEAPHYSDNDDR